MRTPLRQRGFTLLELIIVIAIISIFIGVSYSRISAVFPYYRLRDEARELAINFKKAKIEAVKRNRDVVILFVDAVAGVQNGSYRIFVNMDRDVLVPHTIGAGDILLVNQLIHTNVQLVSNFSNDQAGYDSRGLPIQLANQDVVLSTNDGSRSLTLTVSQVGNVRLR